MKKTTFGVIVGNRGFFPDVLAKQGRKDILDVLKKNGNGAVALSMQDAKYGAVQTFEQKERHTSSHRQKSQPHHISCPALTELPPRCRFS